MTNLDRLFELFVEQEMNYGWVVEMELDILDGKLSRFQGLVTSWKVSQGAGARYKNLDLIATNAVDNGDAKL